MNVLQCLKSGLTDHAAERLRLVAAHKAAIEELSGHTERLSEVINRTSSAIDEIDVLIAHFEETIERMEGRNGDLC